MAPRQFTRRQVLRTGAAAGAGLLVPWRLTGWSAAGATDSEAHPAAPNPTAIAAYRHGRRFDILDSLFTSAPFDSFVDFVASVRPVNMTQRRLVRSAFASASTGSRSRSTPPSNARPSSPRTASASPRRRR